VLSELNFSTEKTADQSRLPTIFAWQNSRKTSNEQNLGQNSTLFRGANRVFGPETVFDPQSKPTTPRKSDPQSKPTTPRKRGKKAAQIDAKMTKTTHFVPKRQKKGGFCTIFFALSTDLIDEKQRRAGSG